MWRHTHTGGLSLWLWSFQSCQCDAYICVFPIFLFLFLTLNTAWVEHLNKLKKKKRSHLQWPRKKTDNNPPCWKCQLGAGVKATGPTRAAPGSCKMACSSFLIARVPAALHLSSLLEKKLNKKKDAEKSTKHKYWFGTARAVVFS